MVILWCREREDGESTVSKEVDEWVGMAFVMVEWLGMMVMTFTRSGQILIYQKKNATMSDTWDSVC